MYRMSDLCPLRRQPRVSPDAAHEVELALAVATQVDGPGCHVDVHEVVDDPALDVVLDPINQVPAAHVEDLDVGQVPARSCRLQNLKLERLCLFMTFLSIKFITFVSQRFHKCVFNPLRLYQSRCDPDGNRKNCLQQEETSRGPGLVWGRGLPQTDR